MTGSAHYLWLIPVLPLLAAGVTALMGRERRQLAASLAIGALVISCFLACGAFVSTLGHAEHGAAWPTGTFRWLTFGQADLRLGWILDPLSAIMVVMVTFVGALIFIYSVGYMAHDPNFTRFFCFLALFAAAMLGLVIANDLLLLFICWELVGLASYLLIGFWYARPSAAAAAKKAFIVTRIGDLGLFLGMLWLYAESGTLLFYDHGQGCLEGAALTRMAAQTVAGGMLVSTAVSLLIFCGAIGKSGQVPLHVWLPDAMEGPTPVSALIHAATMVAAGVFLVARVYPLMSAAPAGSATATTALTAVTWVGAITAVFAALIAVAQTDIKRILAYSTVSQLGFMMLGIGTAGYAVGLFHLITHAFFKALLFLGAGSVIHGSHEEQDIRRMGGLRRAMPVTFATYAVGMMALSGVPLFFSGFWSKDEILHGAMNWPVSKVPFYLGLLGALLTAFYMTRQMAYVFFGAPRSSASGEAHRGAPAPHESPSIMTFPLAILAACTVLLTLVGTPFWPWFHAYVSGHLGPLPVAPHVDTSVVFTLLASGAIALGAIALGWWVYGRNPKACAGLVDPLEAVQPDLFALLRHKFFVDDLYELTVIRATAWLSRACDWLDRVVWSGLVLGTAYLMTGLSWINRAVDEFVVNLGFDRGCDGLRGASHLLSLWQNGRVQRYLRIIGLALTLAALAFFWRTK